eukprot:GILI01000406.1.p1 GENE.GILI01000406.1~~GILI01000406.1.p1  ORF type:complete len:214 (-),score=98.13 GILI01000406.1:80-721(-)
MPKGNNAIPHVHQRKHYHPCSSQKGNLKVFLAQPKQKERRRRLRLQKAKQVFPRPLRQLRPVVACPTIRYNSKKRLGAGFTTEELAGAGLNVRYAATIGITVDARRKNISEEGLQANIQRLKTYTSKLVLFPINHKKVAKGEASEQEQKSAVQNKNVNAKAARKTKEAPRKLTSTEASTNTYAFLKKNHSAARFLGDRIRRQDKKQNAKKDKE